MSDYDWMAGTPSKLKGVALETLEKKLASVVDELVKGDGKIRANITSFEIKEDMRGEAFLKIKFSRDIEFNIFNSEEK